MEDLERLLPALRASAQRRVAADVAEDLVQEAVLIFLSKESRSREARPYLYGILRNLIRRHLQQPRRPPSMTDATGDGIQRVAVRRALARLPRRTRERIVAQHVFGYTTRELAAREGRSRGAIVRDLRAAAQELRAQLSR